MLTDEAQFRREWQGLPLLGKLLGQRRLSENAEIGLYGATSVSDNIFTEFDRLIRTFAIVKDQREVLRAFVADATCAEAEGLLLEVNQLSDRLRRFGEHLQGVLAPQMERLLADLARNIRRGDR